MAYSCTGLCVVGERLRQSSFVLWMFPDSTQCQSSLPACLSLLRHPKGASANTTDIMLSSFLLCCLNRKKGLLSPYLYISGLLYCCSVTPRYNIGSSHLLFTSSTPHGDMCQWLLLLHIQLLGLYKVELHVGICSVC